MTKRIYYGWWVLAAAFGTLFVCAGIGFSTLAVFLKVIEVDMQWGRDVISNAGAFATLAAGFFSPLVGYIVDRYGIRTAMIPGVIVLSASFFLLSRVATPAELYLLYLAVGIGMSATTILPSQTLVSRWFDKKRGRAMGIVTVASGLGNVVWILVSTRLVEVVGWRIAYSILGIIIAVVSLPLVIFVIRSAPASMGLNVDGESSGASAGEDSSSGPAPAEEEGGLTVREALRFPALWLIIAATIFAIAPSAGFGLHAIAFFTDAKLSPEKAALVWSTMMGISIGARFLFGWISEAFQKRYLAAAANVVRGVSMFLLVLFSMKVLPPALAILQLAVLYGPAHGCNNVTSPLIVGETFGTKAFGKLMGMLGIPYTIGMAAGMMLAGRLYVLSGNYNIAFIVFAASFVCAGVCISLARPLYLFETRAAAQGVKG